MKQYLTLILLSGIACPVYAQNTYAGLRTGICLSSPVYDVAELGKAATYTDNKIKSTSAVFFRYEKKRDYAFDVALERWTSRQYQEFEGDNIFFPAYKVDRSISYTGLDLGMQTCFSFFRSKESTLKVYLGATVKPTWQTIRTDMREEWNNAEQNVIYKTSSFSLWLGVNKTITYQLSPKIGLMSSAGVQYAAINKRFTELTPPNYPNFLLYWQLGAYYSLK